MYTKVEICNMALANYGGGEIVSLTENTEEARVLNLLYENCRQAILAKGIWNFATSYTGSLALLDEAEHPTYKYVYALPSKCLKVLQVYNSNIDLQFQQYMPDYEVFNYGSRKALATDIEGAKCKYVVDEDNTAIYTPEFVTCLSYLLSARCVESLTGNAQIVSEMDAKYQVAFQDALLSNARENKSNLQYPSGFLDFRNSNGIRKKLRGW